MKGRKDRFEIVSQHKGQPLRITFEGADTHLVQQVAEAIGPDVELPVSVLQSRSVADLRNSLGALASAQRKGAAWEILEAYAKDLGILFVRIVQFKYGGGPDEFIAFDYDDTGGFGREYIKHNYRYHDAVIKRLAGNFPCAFVYPRDYPDLDVKNLKIQATAAFWGLHEFLGVAEHTGPGTLWMASLGAGKGGIEGLPKVVLDDLTLMVQRTMHYEYRLHQGQDYVADLEDYGFTPTEIKVAGQMASDLTNKEISTRLGIARSTLGAHITKIRDKLGMPGVSRTQVVARLKDLLGK